MPRLWEETIDAHRRAVREAILDTAAGLVARHGVASVTMSQIAQETGIGRATLYKYFPDVEAILVAWHDRQVTAHLAHLAQVRDRATGARHRVEVVLEAFASLQNDHHVAGISALVHRDEHLARHHHHLNELVEELLREAAAAGELRDDVVPAELASYCLSALKAASHMPSKAAIRRLVAVTMSGLQPR